MKSTNESSSQSIRRMRCDVLVVGGALAGLSAAIAARQGGADVLLLSEGQPGRSGSTLYANGYITSCPADQQDVLAEQILWTGGYLANPDLVRVLVERIGAANEQLQSWGLRMQPVAETQQPSGLQMERVPRQPKGLAMGQVLAKQAVYEGVNVHAPYSVITLLRHPQTGILGALAVDMTSQELVAIAAPQVILATGGGARAFAHSDNPAGTTGDGFRLALEAGAELVDIELINFNVPDVGVDSILAAGPESIEDQGGAHYFLGGIRIDESARTKVPGLLAAGEATGGVFGAARLGGSALAECLVFGLVAGETAAQQNVNRSVQNELLEAELAQATAVWLPSTTGKVLAIADQQAEIQNIAWKQVGFVKDAANLQAAVHDLEAKLALIEQWRASSPAELVRLQKLRSILLTVLAAAAASLLREESRGNFWRSDYPRPDSLNALYNSITCWADDQIRVTKQPLPATNVEGKAPIRVAPGCLRYDFSLGKHK